MKVMQWVSETFHFDPSVTGGPRKSHQFYFPQNLQMLFVIFVFGLTVREELRVRVFERRVLGSLAPTGTK
jgi:hypothetical protein